LAQCLIAVVSTAPAQSQSTVGDATRFLFQQGKAADYGIQGGNIGGAQFGQDLFTRHEKEGNSLGIGSSSLQTTNATSESGVASIAPFSVTQTQKESPRPGVNLGSAIQGYSTTSPALSGFTVTPDTGMYSSSGLTSSFAESNYGSGAPTSLYQDLNAVPSFSRTGPRISLPSASVDSGSDSVLKKGEFQY